MKYKYTVFSRPFVCKHLGGNSMFMGTVLQVHCFTRFKLTAIIMAKLHRAKWIEGVVQQEVKHKIQKLPWMIRIKSWWLMRRIS